MRKKILDTISPESPNMTIRLHRMLKRTCNGTAHWLQERRDYLNWLVGKGMSLWVRGKGTPLFMASKYAMLLTF